MKRCTKCGEEKPLEDFYVDRRSKTGLTSHCRECINARQRTYREENPEKVAAAIKSWGERNPEKRREYTRRWQTSHPEQLAASKKAYREANKEKVAAYWASYYEANRERLLARGREWAAANPEKKRAARDPVKMNADFHRRRARLAAVEREEWTRPEIYERDGGVCQLCRKALDFEESATWHIDHIVPVTLGGPDIRANLQLACRSCNLKKHARLEGQTHFAA